MTASGLTDAAGLIADRSHRESLPSLFRSLGLDHDEVVGLSLKLADESARQIENEGEQDWVEFAGYSLAYGIAIGIELARRRGRRLRRGGRARCVTEGGR